MRRILLILDGLEDRGQDCFEGMTRLHAAYTPHLDYLSSLGMNGLYHSYLQGVPMSSETAHFLIFGYELKEFPGRGYVEAIGKGIPVKSNEVAVLCHICCVENRNNNLFLTWGRPEISQEEAHMLMNEIQSFEANNVKVYLIPSQGIDGFLILSGELGEYITDSDPIYEGKAVMEIASNRKKDNADCKKDCINA